MHPVCSSCVWGDGDGSRATTAALSSWLPSSSSPPPSASSSGAAAVRHKVWPIITHPDATFVGPDVVSANAPADLTAEALRRMEAFVLRTIHEIVNLQRPQLSPVARAAKRSRLGGDTSSSSTREGGNICCDPSSSSSSSSSSSPNVLQESRLRVVRLQLLVLRLLHRNLHLGLISTQRDVYYHLARLVPDQGCVNRTIQQLVQLLGVPRQWLGVVPGTRGCIGGSLNFHGVDLRRHGSEGLPLPTVQEELHVTWGVVVCRTAAAVTEGVYHPTNGFELHEQTRYIIVVEKHAVFFRLMEERIFDNVPCVLLTSHGFPTVSARVLLANLHRAAPQVPVVALVDYNPSGLSILQQYKHSLGAMLESHYAAVPALRWLGLRSCHITQQEFANPDDGHRLPAVQQESVVDAASIRPRIPFQRFGRRDEVMLSNLISRWHLTWSSCEDGGASEAWYAEALRMQGLGIKVELEALYDGHTADETSQVAHASSSSFVPTASSSSSSAAAAAAAAAAAQQRDGRDFSGWVRRALLHRDYI